MQFVAAIGAVDIGHRSLGTNASFSAVSTKGMKFSRNRGSASFQFLLVFGDLLELVFHGGCEADIHDHVEIVFEHFGDDVAEFGGLERPFSLIV